MVLIKIKIDKIVQTIFLIIGLICASTIIFIILFIFIKGIKPFVSKYDGEQNANLFYFLFGTTFLRVNMVHWVLSLILYLS